MEGLNSGLFRMCLDLSVCAIFTCVVFVLSGVFFLHWPDLVDLDERDGCCLEQLSSVYRSLPFE